MRMLALASMPQLQFEVPSDVAWYSHVRFTQHGLQTLRISEQFSVCRACLQFCAAPTLTHK